MDINRFRKIARERRLKDGFVRPRSKTWSKKPSPQQDRKQIKQKLQRINNI